MKNKYSIFNIPSFLLMGFVSLVSCSTTNEDLNNGEALSITSFSPKESCYGQEVILKGTGFGDYRDDANGKVLFNGQEVNDTDYVSYSNHRIVVKAPYGVTTGAISVSAFGQTANTDTVFTALEWMDPNILRILDVEPKAAYPSNTVTITGINFGKSAKGTKVYFGDVQATNITSFSSNEMKVVVPDDAKTGKLTIDNGTQTVSTDYDFQVNQGATITGITPKQAWVGDEITISGENIFDVPASDVTVNFSGAMATATSVSGNTIKVKVPEGAANGTFTVTFKDKQTIPGVVFQRYALYGKDFSTSTSEDDIAPFVIANAYAPNYIKVVDGYLECYYDSKTYEKYAQTTSVRKYKGCELYGGNFNSWSEGWYGFSFYLPTDASKSTYHFPVLWDKTHDGNVISQIFMNGDGKTWASLIKVDGPYLTVHHRAASATPTIDRVGTVRWDAWNTFIIHFRAGKNGTKKGLIECWLNVADPKASAPTAKFDHINFGWGNWLDDNTLDGEVSRDNLQADYFGAKFGMYVQGEPSLCMRYGEIRCLEGNPSGAIDMVKPRRDYPAAPITETPINGEDGNSVGVGISSGGASDGPVLAKRYRSAKAARPSASKRK